MSIDFRLPARLDETLQVGVALRECRRASLVIAQTVERHGVRLLDAEVRIAALRASDFKPQPIPDMLYPQLKALQEVASTPPISSNAE